MSRVPHILLGADIQKADGLGIVLSAPMDFCETPGSGGVVGASRGYGLFIPVGDAVDYIVSGAWAADSRQSDDRNINSNEKSEYYDISNYAAPSGSAALESAAVTAVLGMTGGAVIGADVVNPLEPDPIRLNQHDR